VRPPSMNSDALEAAEVPADAIGVATVTPPSDPQAMVVLPAPPAAVEVAEGAAVAEVAELAEGTERTGAPEGSEIAQGELREPASGAASSGESAVHDEPPAPATVPASPGAVLAQPTRGLRLAPGKRLQLRVGSAGARLDLVAGWRRTRMLASRQIEFRAGTASLAEALPPCETLLLALAGALGSIRGLPCDVVIGDTWLLYDVIRADLRALAPRVADDVVRSSLADIAGVAPEAIETRWQAQPGGPSSIACGIPAAALTLLLALLETHRLRPGRIVGEFVHEFNARRSLLDSRSAVISLVRETGTQLALASAGVIAAMSFELGIRAPEELEIRARGLARGAGLELDGQTRYFALLPAGWLPPAPWIAVPTTI